MSTLHKRKRALDVALVIWVLATLIPGGYLMASHVIALPVPPANGLERALGGMRKPVERDRPLAVHVLLGTCGCSAQVLERLIARGPRADVVERVLMVEASANEPLLVSARARGFSVEALDAQELALRYAIESAPMLMVLSPQGRLSYAGGYGRNLDVLDRVVRGETVAALPVFGCAVSNRLKKTLDPLGLKN
jgi:hypothetical protein